MQDLKRYQIYLLLLVLHLKLVLEQNTRKFGDNQFFQELSHSNMN